MQTIDPITLLVPIPIFSIHDIDMWIDLATFSMYVNRVVRELRCSWEQDHKGISQWQLKINSNSLVYATLSIFAHGHIHHTGPFVIFPFPWVTPPRRTFIADCSCFPHISRTLLPPYLTPAASNLCIKLLHLNLTQPCQRCILFFQSPT